MSCGHVFKQEERERERDGGEEKEDNPQGLSLPPPVLLQFTLSLPPFLSFALSPP